MKLSSLRLAVPLFAWTAACVPIANAHEFKLDAVINAFVKIEPGEAQLVIRAPLYLFKADTASGDAHGQGFEHIWYAVSASGARVATAPPAATIKLSHTALGDVLVDSQGMTLYMFTPDTSSTSACYGPCAAVWPPLTLNGKLRAAIGLQTPLLGTIQRTDGSTQITYGGHPLYYFAKDAKAGDTNGQGLFTKWWVLSATGSPIGAP